MIDARVMRSMWASTMRVKVADGRAIACKRVPRSNAGETADRLGKPSELDSKCENQQVGDEEVRHRYCAEADNAHDPIDDAVLADGGQNTEGNCQRDRNACSDPGEEESILQSEADLLDNRPTVGERCAKISLCETREPVPVAKDRRIMEAQRTADRLHRFRRGRLSQDSSGDITGEEFGACEDKHRDRQQRQQPQTSALGN